MKRREFIMGLGSAAAWPLAARAQQPAMPVIGFLCTETAVAFATRVAAFRRGLSETGYVEGRNVAIEYRWAEGKYDRLPALAADLVSRKVTVIAANGLPSAPAAKAATATIPIVFQTGADPVTLGLVASLNRPGGNVTGVTNIFSELRPKLLELLHELVPTATVMALLVNPANPTLAETQSSDLLSAARILGLQLHVLHASTDRDFDPAFASLTQLRADALVISNDALLNTHSERLAALALRHAVPTISGLRDFAAAGGLMSYGTSIVDAYRLVGVYTGRILKGEKPADLPVMQADQVRVRDQPQDRQGARPHHPGNAVGHRRRGHSMKRRDFIAGLGGAAAWPLAARAQQRPVPVIGFLSTGFADDYKMVTVPFLQSLKESGYVVGQNVAIEYRWAEDQFDRLPALAADLVRRRVAVIVAFGITPAQPAKAATTTIPIVFYTGTDPVASGLVASLNRPGGNLTGSAVLAVELMPKRLQLLRELIPDAALFGVLVSSIPNPPSRTCKRRDARWACNSLLRLLETIANSKRPSQLFRKSTRVGLSCPTVPSTTGAWTNSRRWRSAMRCQRSTHTVSSPSPAA